MARRAAITKAANCGVPLPRVAKYSSRGGYNDGLPPGIGTNPAFALQAQGALFSRARFSTPFPFVVRGIELLIFDSVTTKDNPYSFIRGGGAAKYAA